MSLSDRELYRLLEKINRQKRHMLEIKSSTIVFDFQRVFRLIQQLDPAVLMTISRYIDNVIKKEYVCNVCYEKFFTESERSSHYYAMHER